MSVAFFLITDTKLKKTEFKYKDIIEDYKPVFSNDDGIEFCDNMLESEQFALGKIGEQYFRYAIRASVELEFAENMRFVIGDAYFNCAKKQLLWLKSFMKKHLKNSFEIFIIRLTLGERTKFGHIVTEYIDIDEFIVPNDHFMFNPLVMYQFVDNSPAHIEWVKNKNK